MEPNDVRTHHPIYNRVSLAQREKDLWIGEGDVQEEPNPRIGQTLSHHAGDQEQLVIVNPDRVSVTPPGDDRLRILPVYGFVILPAAHAQRQPVKPIVTEGPEDAVCDSIVEAVDFARAQLDRGRRKLVELTK